jgi:ribonuclease BN (tRNA processing enzyme)
VEVLFIGTGASVFPGRRAQSSILVWDENSETERLLLDAGPPLQQRLSEENIGVAQIDYIIITHLHADHVLGLPGFFHELKAKGVKKLPTIYAPQDSVKPLEELLTNYGPRDIKLEIIGVSEGDVVRTKHHRISFTKTLHPVTTLAVRLEDRKGKTLFYSSDTAYDARLERLAKADIGIHEATIPVSMEDRALEIGMHSSPRQALKVLSGCKIRVLTHISLLSFKDPFNDRGLEYIISYDGLRIRV